MPSYDVVHWSAYQAQRTATIYDQDTINFSFKMTITFVLRYLPRSADKG